MAVSILEKFRLVVFGNVHSLLDAIIDETSPEAIAQNIRDLENAIEELKSEATNAEGDMNFSIEKLTKIKNKIEDAEENIAILEGDDDKSNDENVLPLQVKLIGLEDSLEVAQEEVDTYKQSVDALESTISALEGKLQGRMAQLNLSKSKDNTTDAKDKAAKAIEMANKFESISSVDNLSERIDRKASIADVRLKKAMQGMNKNVDEDIVVAKARARIAERRKAASEAKQK